jgi:hypothetical protein
MAAVAQQAASDSLILGLTTPGEAGRSPLLAPTDLPPETGSPRTSTADPGSFPENDAALVSATQSPLGALGVVLGSMCSMLGFSLVLLSSSAHCAAEWPGQTIKEIHIAGGGRGTFAATKVLSIFLFALWSSLCSWLVLIVWGLLSKRLFPIQYPASGRATIDWLLPMLRGSLLVLFLFVVFCVFLCVTIRNPIGVVLSGAVVVVGCNIVTRFDSIAIVSPAAWVAAFMGFERHNFLQDHIWANRNPDLTTSTAGLAITALTALLLFLSFAVIRRRDVLP